MKSLCISCNTVLSLALLVMLLFNFAPAQSVDAAGFAGRVTPQVLPPAPSTCNPCLYYSGDFDSSSPDADGLRNAKLAWSNGLVDQVWVPFTATSDGVRSAGVLVHKHILVSSITFNMLTSSASPTDIGKTTFAFRTLVSSRDPGMSGPKGTCASVSVTPTGRTAFGMSELSYTCNLATSVKLAIGVNYWVNVLPTFTTGTDAFASDVPTIRAPSQFGWGDDYYNSYFNSPTSGLVYTPATDWGPLYEFSIAIAGTYTT